VLRWLRQGLRGAPRSLRPVPVSDLALVSLGTTPGLRAADAALARMVRELGLSCVVAPVHVGAVAGRLRRQIAVTDAVEALAARRAGRELGARAAVFSTVTAALLQPRPAMPHAIRFDAPAALNRPGPSGAWQRAAERRAIARATLLLPWGEAAARALPEGPPRFVLPVPVEAPTPVAASARDTDVVAYAGYPRKRGLDLLCAAWWRSGAGAQGRRLTIAGVPAGRGRAWLTRCGVAEPPGLEWVGSLPRERWLERVARARVFVNASRWEDHGLSQLEALAAGTPLVTVPSPGAYEALPLARTLDATLVAGELSAEALAQALRAGLGLSPGALAAYGARAAELLAPYRPDAVRATLAERVLPALGLEVP